MAIHYNDNYRSAYQHLQKTLDRLSKFSDRKEPQMPEYHADVLQEGFAEPQAAEQAVVKSAINLSSVHSLNQLEQARAQHQACADYEANASSASRGAKHKTDCSDEIANQSRRANAISRSFWVSVSDTEQWHIKEFVPGSEHLANRFEVEDFNLAIEQANDGARAISHNFINTLIESYLEKTALLLHGEFGSGRCFYDDDESGLAWKMANQGYHVFVIDMTGRKRCPGVLEKQNPLQRLRALFNTNSDSRFVREFLPAAIKACGKRVIEEIAPGLSAAALSKGIENESAALMRYKAQQQLATIDDAGVPRVWGSHGFGAAWLTAAWARMPDDMRQAERMVFFEGFRHWKGGSLLSKSIAKVMSSSLSRHLVRALGRFPACKLGLGTVDEPRHVFDVYSRWINEEDWIDPEDGVDYQRALQEKRLPAILHIMNEDENCLIPGSAVRRFSNELAPLSADLISIPTSLEAIARDLFSAESEDTNAESLAAEETDSISHDIDVTDIEIPVFAYSEMLLHPDADRWIFNPVLQWLDSVAVSAQDQTTVEACDLQSAEKTAHNGNGGRPNGYQLDLADFLPSPA